jgi:hypothetical protein
MPNPIRPAAPVRSVGVMTGRILLAVVVGLVGLVWLGQGLGLIPGSFMTGSAFWAVVGGLLVAAAGVVGWWAYRSTYDR